MKLSRDFFARNTLEVARDLLGMHLVRKGPGGRERVGRIVETEAYRSPGDRAAHSYRGPTPRTAVMFGPPGHAYVFLVYGFWHCLNFVTEPEGHGCAVLLRAIEPVAGLAAKTWGPGLLCRAMDIDKRLNGVDLLGDVLWLEEPVSPRPVRVGRSARIGVEYAGRCARRPWRFYDRDSPFVSTAKRSRADSPDTKRSRSSR
jgi:DNA-3-methyladenine glycosylase